MYNGAEVHGELHSVDASAGQEVTLYDAGSDTVITVGPNEALDIHFVQLVSAAGGDCRVFIGDDSTPGSSETVVRGTFGTFGGIASELRPHYSGKPGGKLFAKAPTGELDVIIKGTLRRA